MKYADVTENVRQLLDELPSQDEFIYELLLAYGSPKASITRLKQGTYNQSKVSSEVLWENKVWFKNVGWASSLSNFAAPNKATGRSPTSQRRVKMPDGLRAAHHTLGLAVDRLYRGKPFASAKERLEHLFKLYEEMTAKERLV